MTGSKNMEDKNIQSKRRFNFRKFDFSNALVVLIGFAMLSVIIYAAILRVSSPNSDEVIPNQLNNQFEEETRQEVTSGVGYEVYKVDGQFFLEITDGSKIRDVNALLKSLDLPENAEIINPAANYARPIPQDQIQEPNQHQDLEFGEEETEESEEPSPTPSE